MPQRIKTTRKARFKAALSLAGMTQKEWSETNGVNPQHLNGVISETQSRTGGKELLEKIDSFIAATEKKAAKRGYGAFLRDLNAA